MPKLTPEELRELEMERRMAAWEDFAAGEKWKRSSRGNFWRIWDGDRVTIYRRDDGLYVWCAVYSDESKVYSRRGFELEEDALFDSYRELIP
jgi:hypothetical protein